MDNFFNDDIKKQILAYTNQKNIEIEARFNDFQNQRGVSVRTFDRLLTYYNARGYTSTCSHTEDQNYNKESLRLSIDSTGKKTLLRKVKQPGFPQIIKEYGIKIGISSEELLVTSEESLKDFQEKISKESDVSIRIKKRTSFALGESRLDLTTVDMVYFDTDKKLSDTKYEVELELLPGGSLNEWYQLMYELLKVIEDTEIIYTEGQYLKIIDFTNIALGDTGKNKKFLDTRNLMDARNLKYRDIVYGGLVNPDKITYRVSVKTDGIRKICVIENDGIWFLWDTEANKIQNGSTFSQEYHGYIFDGELIPPEN